MKRKRMEEAAAAAAEESDEDKEMGMLELAQNKSLINEMRKFKRKIGDLTSKLASAEKHGASLQASVSVIDRNWAQVCSCVLCHLLKPAANSPAGSWTKTSPLCSPRWMRRKNFRVSARATTSTPLRTVD
jgi:hypothetical protein